MATSATINGNSHNDTFNLDLHTTTPITINGGGAEAAPTQTVSFDVGPAALSQTYGVGDTVNLNDSTDTANETTFITTGFVQLVGGAAMNMNGIGTLNLSTGTGDDIVSVFGTPASQTTVNAGGNLTMQVSGTADFSSLIVNAPAAGSLNVGINSTGLGSLLQLNGGSGGNTYVVFGTGQAAGLQLNGGSGNDVMYLLASAVGELPGAQRRCGDGLVHRDGERQHGGRGPGDDGDRRHGGHGGPVGGERFGEHGDAQSTR